MELTEMELGTYQRWVSGLEEIYADLGIKWFGCGFSALADTHDAIDQVKCVEQVIEKGGKPFLKWVCDVTRTRDIDQFFKECERDFIWIAKNVPAKHIEIFPEPSCPLVTGRELMIADYFEVLRIAYQTIKEIDPTIQVWNGGIGFFRTIWSLGDFFEEGLPLTDALNLHPFMFGNTWGQVVTRISNLLLEGLWSMEVLHQVKPLIVTEWGVPTEWRGADRYESHLERTGVPALSEEDQAIAYINILDQFKALGCTIFCFGPLCDAVDNISHWGGHTGFIGPDGAKKVSYQAVKDWVAGQDSDPAMVKEMRSVWMQAPELKQL